MLRVDREQSEAGTDVRGDGSATVPRSRHPCLEWLQRRVGILVCLTALIGVALFDQGSVVARAQNLRSASNTMVDRVFLPMIVGTTMMPAAQGSGAPLLFGVYPGGATGETPNVPTPSESAVVQKLQELAGGHPFLVHLYTAWSWYNADQLDQQITQYANAGFQIVLTIKYSPPSGHDGDVAGYAAFVRNVVSRYASNPAVTEFVIGNEANVTDNPSSSDGAFQQADLAVVQGVIAAQSQVSQVKSRAQVGVNFAETSADADRGFLQTLVQLGGRPFVTSVQFVGVDFYPGLWPAGTGQPYQDMRTDLQSARTSVDGVTDLRGLPLDVLEVGAPLLSDQDLSNHLSQFIQATQDVYAQLGIRSFIWFDLWDADSQSSNVFAHYGLLHSDLTAKPAFQILQSAIAAAQD